MAKSGAFKNNSKFLIHFKTFETGNGSRVFKGTWAVHFASKVDLIGCSLKQFQIFRRIFSQTGRNGEKGP